MANNEQKKLIDGKWYITELIGQGSYGRVYKVSRNDVFNVGDSDSAMKIISIPRNKSEFDVVMGKCNNNVNDTATVFKEVLESLLREIKIMSELDYCKNIVSIKDYNIVNHTDEVGWDILIRMELLTPLPKYFKGFGKVTEKEVVQLGIDISKALEACRENNVVHRDIKPENIFVNKYGTFKLGDFGVARSLNNTEVFSTRAGSAGFMAPEVYNNHPGGYKVDIYSLGMVMYHYLNYNRAPFAPLPPAKFSFHDNEVALAARMKGDKALPKPCFASAKVAEIILKACAFDPSQRYRTPTEMREALEAVMPEAGTAPLTVELRGESSNDSKADDHTIGIFDENNVKNYDPEKQVDKVDIHIPASNGETDPQKREIKGDEETDEEIEARKRKKEKIRKLLIIAIKCGSVAIIVALILTLILVFAGGHAVREINPGEQVTLKYAEFTIEDVIRADSFTEDTTTRSASENHDLVYLLGKIKNLDGNDADILDNLYAHFEYGDNETSAEIVLGGVRSTLKPKEELAIYIYAEVPEDYFHEEQESPCSFTFGFKDRFLSAPEDENDCDQLFRLTVPKLFQNTSHISLDEEVSASFVKFTLNSVRASYDEYIYLYGHVENTGYKSIPSFEDKLFLASNYSIDNIVHHDPNISIATNFNAGLAPASDREFYLQFPFSAKMKESLGESDSIALNIGFESNFETKPETREECDYVYTLTVPINELAYTAENGDTYIGEWSDGKYNGHGKIITPKGDTYEGNFEDGKLNGKGKFTWSTGGIYEGDFVDGGLNGKGIYTGSNGNSYEGDFVDWEFNGKGKFTWSNGDTYEGDFADGKLNGKGKTTWSNGDTYEGDYVKGAMSGEGIYTTKDGTQTRRIYENGKLIEETPL